MLGTEYLEFEEARKVVWAQNFANHAALTHWKNLSLRSNAYERIMSKVNLTYLTFCQVLRIALLITSMDINNVTENSIINDIYKLDPKTAKIDDIDTILKRHDINTRNDNKEQTEDMGQT